MRAKLGPREARLREMRERQHEERQKRPQMEPEARAAKVALAKALSNTSNTPPQSNSKSAPFDKTAYQREYMRKRRAKAKAVT